MPKKYINSHYNKKLIYLFTNLLLYNLYESN